MQQENAELLALQRIDDTGTKLQQEVKAMLMHMVRGASCLSCQTDVCTALLLLVSGQVLGGSRMHGAWLGASAALFRSRQ